MLEDKLLLQLGVRGTQIRRDFTNYANSGSTNILGASTADYDISKTYGKVLPNIGLRYRLDEQQHSQVRRITLTSKTASPRPMTSPLTRRLTLTLGQ